MVYICNISPLRVRFIYSCKYKSTAQIYMRVRMSSTQSARVYTQLRRKQHARETERYIKYQDIYTISSEGASFHNTCTREILILMHLQYYRRTLGESIQTFYTGHSVDGSMRRTEEGDFTVEYHFRQEDEERQDNLKEFTFGPYY